MEAKLASTNILARPNTRRNMMNLLFVAATTLTLQSDQSVYRERPVDGYNCTAHAFSDRGLLLLKDEQYPHLFNFTGLTIGPGQPDAVLHSFSFGTTPEGYYTALVPVYFKDGYKLPEDVVPPFTEVKIGGTIRHCLDTPEMEYILANNIDAVNFRDSQQQYPVQIPEESADR